MTRRPARGSLIGEGVADPLSVTGRRPTVLAFHGLTGTPQEVALVVEVAAKLGLAAEAPLLPGHGSSVAELSSTRFCDWLAAAEQHYAQCAERGKVIVAGLSMGALLALHLAKNHPENVAGVIALANAMWLHTPWPTWPLKLLHRLRAPDFWMPKAGPDLGDREQRAVHLTYNAQPVRAAISLLCAGEELSTELHRVKAPALLIHGELDAVTPVSNAWRVAVRLGSLQKRTVILPRSRHIVTRDVERDVVERELTAFLTPFSSAADGQRPVLP